MIQIEIWAYRRLLALAKEQGHNDLAAYLEGRFLAFSDFANRRAKTRQGEPPVIGSAFGFEEES